MKSLPGRILLFVTILFLLITGFYAYRCWEVSRCDPFGLADPGMVYEPVLEVGFRDRLHFHMRTKDADRLNLPHPIKLRSRQSSPESTTAPPPHPTHPDSA